MKIDHVFFDFDGVFTDNRVYVFQDGTEAVSCSRADGIGLKMLKDAGIGITILSTETNPVVHERAKKLGVPCVQGCEDKERFMMLLGQSGRVDLNKVAFVGNDINDKGAMELVGYPITVCDSRVFIKKGMAYITESKGGHGAVREACEWVIERLREGADYVEFNCNRR